MNESTLVSTAGKLKALAEPNRLKIIQLLKQGVHCNCELGEQLKMAPNLISHHLRVLNEAGLIETERDQNDARWVYFSLNTVALDELSAELSDILDTRRIEPRDPCCGPSRKQRESETASPSRCA